MKTYVGLRTSSGDTRSYQVTVKTPAEDYPLDRLTFWYSELDWDAEYGLRDLSLLMWLDYFEEHHVTPLMLLNEPEKVCKAWLPHRYFWSVLHDLLKNMQDGEWIITEEWMTAWLTEWAEANHKRFAYQKYGASYGGESYDAWKGRLLGLMAKNGALSLATVGMTEVWCWTAYLSGYQPHHIAYLWAVDRIAELRNKINPNRKVTSTIVWNTVPVDDDYEF